MKHLKIVSIIIAGFLYPVSSFTQEYKLVWEDNFNGTTLDSSVWNIEQRVGVWNTGSNSELEHYKKENVTIGDDGNGNSCLILTAKKEDYNGYGFTSGRINTKGKLTFRFGKLEARIKTPDLANGLWPAFWTLGYTPKGWPDCGETDILEMGHSAGISSGTQNKYIGAACHWENAGVHAGYYQNYTAPSNLNEDYHVYTLIWTNTKIEVFLDTATTPFFAMNVSGGDLEEYRDYPQYILLNLAVGGSLTGITNAGGITAPLPGNMYIDYIKLYQQSDKIEFNDSSNSLFGIFGVYEETVAVDMNTDIGFDTQVNTAGLNENSGETPKEGTEVLSYNSTANQEVKVSVTSLVNRNMERYASGSLQFWFKSLASDSIQVGISDTAGNEAFITLKEASSLNPLRDGEWQFAWIPLAELSTQIDFASIKDLFILKANFTQDATFSVDRILWTENEYISTDANYYGIYAEHDSIKAKLNFNEGGHIYVWNGFSGFTTTPFYGEDVLAYNPNTATWNGFGIHSDNPLDLSNYYDGALHFSYNTSNSADIEIGFKNSADAGWKHVFSGSNGIIRDGNWHQLQMNIKDFTFDNGAFTTNDLKDIVIPFYMVGTVKLSLDEIYLSKNGVALSYPEIPVSTDDISVSEEISIYPVPAVDFICIKGLNENALITVYDQLGKAILSQEVKVLDKIALASLKSGIYIIHARYGSNTKVFHFIKK